MLGPLFKMQFLPAVNNRKLEIRDRCLVLPSTDESGALSGAEDADGDGELGDVVLELLAEVLVLGGVVDEDDLLEERLGRAVDDGVHRPQEGRPRLVVEDDHDRGGGQEGRVVLRLAPERKNGGVS